MTPAGDITPGRLAGTALRLWARHLPVFVALAAAAVSVMYGLVRAMDAWNPRGVEGLLVALAVSLVVAALHTGAAASAALHVLGGGRPPVLRTLGAAVGTFRRAPAVAAVGLLCALAFALFSLLLVVPGLLVAATVAAAPAALLREGLGPVRAIQRSALLTRGHRVAIVAAQLLVALVGLACGFAAFTALAPALRLGGAPAALVLSTALLTVAPLPFVGGAVAYHALVARASPAPAALGAVFE